MADYGFKRRKKICRFCENKIAWVDFKDDRMLRRYVTDRGKIVPRRVSGNCAIHQRSVTSAIKRARLLAFLPFENEHIR